MMQQEKRILLCCCTIQNESATCSTRVRVGSVCLAIDELQANTKRADALQAGHFVTVIKQRHKITQGLSRLPKHSNEWERCYLDLGL